MGSSQALQFATAHLLQLSVVIVIAAVVVRFASRRLPHLAFLICMLALAKCVVPPVITSPAGLFTLHNALSFSPQMDVLDSETFLQLKQTMGDDSAAASAQPPLWGFPTWGVVTLALWSIGSLFLLCYAAWKYRKVTNIIARCTPACRSFRVETDRLAAQLGLKRRVRVMVSAENYGPACVGVLRPTLVLPQTLVANWSNRLLTPVLAHELVHARRGDAAWGYLQFIAQIICWFHPLVWWLGRHAQILCERCCDQEVLSSLKVAPADYAESLVRVLEMQSVCKPLPVGSGMSPVEITEQRIHRLSQPASTRRTHRVTWALALLSAALVLPGMRWATNPMFEVQMDLQANDYSLRVNAAIEHEDWKRAIALLRPLVEKDPQNADALFFLGYALHAEGRIDEAIGYHRLAAKFKSLKPIATYNLACALAIKGDEAEALATLKGSIAGGFIPRDMNLTDDPDLKSLFRCPEFAVLNASVIMQRITPDIVEKIDTRTVRKLLKLPPALPASSDSAATFRPAMAKRADGPSVATTTEVTQNSRRRIIDSRYVTKLPEKTIAVLYLSPSKDDVCLEARLRTPGVPTVDAEVRMQPKENGCIEQTIECKIESSGHCFTRSMLISPEALLPVEGAWQTM